MITLDHNRRALAWRGESYRPTRQQWLICAAMAAHPGWIYSREQLQDAAGMPHCADRNVDSQISRLRRKLRAMGWPDPFDTVIGGYAWSEAKPIMLDDGEFHFARR